MRCVMLGTRPWKLLLHSLLCFFKFMVAVRVGGSHLKKWGSPCTLKCVSVLQLTSTKIWSMHTASQVHGLMHRINPVMYAVHMHALKCVGIELEYVSNNVFERFSFL